MRMDVHAPVGFASSTTRAARFVLVLSLGLLSTIAGAAAPVISGVPPTTAIVGTQYSFTPDAYDPDGNRLRFAIKNQPSWASFDKRTGRLWGTPAQSNIGTYESISIAVRDNAGRSSTWVSLTPFAITVSAESAPAPSNSAPTISGSPPGAVVEGQTYSFTPKASDADGDVLTFSISNKPAWAGFDPATGRLSGVPSNADVGNYTGITISVTDGEKSASLAPFSIAVTSNATGTATLSWLAPTTRADGTALTNLAGYRVMWGTSQGNYPNTVKITNPSVLTYVLENLAPATYYFVVVAFDSNGLVSGQSNVAQKTVPST